MTAWLIELLIELWAAPAALGFAMLFNVPKRALWLCGTLAVIGHGLRHLVDVLHGDLVLGTLAGAVVIGLLAELHARRRHEPGAIYAISAAIPLVPGKSMYESVQAMLGIAVLPANADGSALIAIAGVSAIKAAMILMALAFGIAAPMLLRPDR
ncbi:hypothetical protein IGB42_01577 [Andreprevotia sp. IGB-42]|uniref:threonine/serine exporter family protein n=1 Tax=Andreprevotia sp. IGB-42 TaxID=2497473 RepID=UPI00135CAEC5|nr:threonine/serine exporter family protein [Andreprevotia sp. IGB-42]KAF0813898.1 hypothetical protein IGB42_01577 [Andreprevotia sp. IGB-42]